MVYEKEHSAWHLTCGDVEQISLYSTRLPAVPMPLRHHDVSAVAMPLGHHGQKGR